MGRKIGTILSFATLAMEVFTALFLTPFIIRSFGQAEYGVYTLVLSITSYLALLDFGVGNSVVRFMAKYRATNQVEEQRKFLGITTIYYAAVACIVLVVGTILVYILPSAFVVGLSNEEILLAQRLLGITTVNTAITIGTAGFFYTVIAFENFVVSKGLSILITLLRVIVVVVGLRCGIKSLGVVTVNMIFSLFSRSIIVLFVLLKMKLRPTLKRVKFSQIKEIIAYSAIILLQMIATQINNMADQILIGALAVSSSVILGIYGVGAQINQYFQSFGGAMNGVLMPGVVSLVEQGASPKELQGEMSRIGRMNLAFVGFVWTVFLVFGKQFVVLWSGTVNQEAYAVALLLMFPMIFILSQSVGTQILWAKNKHKTQSFLKLGIVLLNVLLTIVLIQWNPLIGATIGTFISLMLGDVAVMQIVFKKDIGIDLKSYYADLFKGILPSLAISFAVGILFKMLNLTGWFGFILNCLSMTISYFVCMVLFGLNQYERSLINSIKNKFLKKK